MGAVSELVGKYFQYLPPDVRVLVEELGSKLVVETESEPPYLRLGEHRVMLPKDMSLLNYSVELLLRRAGYDTKLGDKLPTVVMVLTQAVREAVEKEVAERVVPIEVRHVTEREELYYGIVKQIMNEYKIKTFYVTTSNNQYVLGMYCFDGIAYRPCETEITKEVEELASGDEELDKKVVRWIINEALSKIKRKTLEPLKYEPLRIAFKNIVFDWERFLSGGSIRASALPPDPETVVFHKIPHRLRLDLIDRLEGLVKYDERLVGNIEELAEEICPETLKAFKDWVGDKWILLFEIIGYTLYPKYDLHKAIMLVGSGRNGKSTYLKLIRDILGPWNVSNISLQDLCDENKRFVVSNLYHKLANIYADLPPRVIQYTGRFKILTGEDYITADRKFKDPVTFINYAKLIFSTNELPPVKDMSLAFWRRWLVIEFPNQFPVNPKFYEETFTEDEIEGCIIVSLLAFRNVWLRKKFSFEETEADYKEKWLRMTNSVYAFLQDLFEGKIEGYGAVKDPNGRVDAEELYSLYTKWCDMEEREALSKRMFTMEMERQGYKRVRLPNGRRFYKGIKLILENQAQLR